jgi:outer membrane protein assembly factor BamB
VGAARPEGFIIIAAGVAVNVERPGFPEHSSWSMVRILAAGGWRHDPALGRAAEAAAGRALAELSGVLTVEVDGVDVTGGRTEGPLLASLEALLGGVAHLLAGGLQAAVPFRGGEVLLVVRRRDAQALLTVATLGRPGRLPVRDVTVDLAALAAAALEASAGLCRDLAGAAEGERAARRLRAAAARVARARPRHPPPGEPLPVAGAPSDAPGPLRCLVALDGDGAPLRLAPGEPADLAALLAPGRLSLAGADGRLLASVDGAPYLALRDLVAGAEEAARALRRGEPRCELALGRPGREGDLLLELDLRAGTVAAPGGPPVAATALELADAAAAGAAAFAGLARARAVAHAGNPALAELVAAAAAARDHLAELLAADARHAPLPAPARPASAAPPQRPLAPGRLQRVVLRRTVEAHAGLPVGPALVAAGRTAIALGRDALVAVAPAAGRVAWRSAGADWGGAAAGLLLVRRGDRLEALDPRTGRPRWSRQLPGARPTGLAGARGGPLLLAEPGALTALDAATGATRWRLDLPGASGLALAALGPLAAAGTDAGVLYGVDLAGRIAWRLRGPGPALAPPVLVGASLASLHAAGPAAALLLADPATGERRGEVALDVLPAGPPLRFAGGLAVAGTSGGEAVLLHVHPGRGRSWETGVPLSGPPALAAAGARLVAGDGTGALSLLGPRGQVRWSLPGGADRGGAAPWLARGLVVAARDGVALVEAAGGRLLATAPGPAPAWLAVGPDLSIAALDADGALTGLAPGGHLSVVD